MWIRPKIIIGKPGCEITNYINLECPLEKATNQHWSIIMIILTNFSKIMSMGEWQW